MMKITGLSHLFKWENLHNWWLTKYFFAPLCVYIYIYIYIYIYSLNIQGLMSKMFPPGIFSCFKIFY